MATDQARLNELTEAANLGLITEEEFEKEWTAAGGTIADAGSTEDMPDDALVAAYAAAKRNRQSAGQRCYLASLIVDRGLAECGCDDCITIRVDARRWREFMARQ